MCYNITKDGKIFLNGIEKKQSNHSKGYKVIWFNGKLNYVHRLVAEHYLPKIDGKNNINHINGDKSDNRVENLEWVNKRDNCEHARLNGLSEKKSQGIINLTKEQILKIKKLRSSGIIYKDIAKMFNRDYRTIWDICNEKRYKEHVL